MADVVKPGANVRLVTAIKPWRPAPFRRGPSPFKFAEAEKRALGQKRLSAALFDHPVMSFTLNVGATMLAAMGTAKFDGVWRILSWAVLIGAGSQALLDVTRLLGGQAEPTQGGGA